MQAVVVALTVSEKERRGPALTRPMAAIEKGRVIPWKLDVDAHRCVPAVRDGRKARVKCCSQLLDYVGQWVGEVFVLAPAEAVARHDDAAAKALFVDVDLSEVHAFFRGQDRWHNGAAVRIELIADTFPIDCANPLGNC